MALHARIRPFYENSGRARRSNGSFKAIIAILMLAFGGSFSLAHATVIHASVGHDCEHTLTQTGGDLQSSTDDTSSPNSGLQHQHCSGCSCLGTFSARVYASAYFDGALVHYFAHFDDGAPKFAPSPLRKPPRVSAST
jgi:hypothetical protein